MGARIFAWCFLGAFTIGSLVSLTISVGSTAQRVWLVLVGSRAEGAVVGLRQSPQTNHGVHVYAPVVQFTAGGAQVGGWVTTGSRSHYVLHTATSTGNTFRLQAIDGDRSRSHRVQAQF